MPYSIDLTEQPACHWVGIRRRVAPAAIGSALAELLPAVAGALGASGVAPLSPPATLYHEHDEEAGMFTISAGFLVAAPCAADTPAGPLESGAIPACSAATTIHLGPYAGLGEAHSALHAWVEEHGREVLAPCWEQSPV